MPNSYDPIFQVDKTRKAIQKAWRAGKRKITVDGIDFDMKKAAGTTTYAFSKTKEKPKGTREQYILLTPSDGSHTPMGQVAIKSDRR